MSTLARVARERWLIRGSLLSSGVGRVQAARIAAAYAADKAAALKAAEERIPEMRRREEERAKARRADRGLKPLPEPSQAALSNGDAPHAEAAPADASEDKEVGCT